MVFADTQPMGSRGDLSTCVLNLELPPNGAVLVCAFFLSTALAQGRFLIFFPNEKLECKGMSEVASLLEKCYRTAQAVGSEHFMLSCILR